jgi:hypothetical protein
MAQGCQSRSTALCATRGRCGRWMGAPQVHCCLVPGLLSRFSECSKRFQSKYRCWQEFNVKRCNRAWTENAAGTASGGHGAQRHHPRTRVPRHRRLMQQVQAAGGLPAQSRCGQCVLACNAYDHTSGMRSGTMNARLYTQASCYQNAERRAGFVSASRSRTSQRR